MGILDGKRLLITGVLTDASLAFGVAKLAQEEGAEIVLTGAGRALRTDPAHRPQAARRARRCSSSTSPNPPTSPRCATPSREKWGRVDGALHAIGFAPESCLGGGVHRGTWDDVAVAMQISAYSLKTIADVVVPLMPEGGSIVGLDFDATVAWPAYDWMGVAKAALESTSRYLARDLGPQGIRVNLVAAGPIRTMAAKSIPGLLRASRTCGTTARRSAGTSTTPPAWPACVACCRTGSPRPPARSSTSTAATTPSARSERPPPGSGTSSGWRPGACRRRTRPMASHHLARR